MSPAPVQISFRKANTIKIDFAYSFRPIYYFSRVYGLMPFTITYNARGSINGLEVRLFDLLWFMAILVLNVTITLMISKDSLYLQDLKVLSNILNGGEYFLEIYCMIFNLLLTSFHIFTLLLIKIMLLFRNKFSYGNLRPKSIDILRKNLVNSMKLFGHQHAHLTNIVDKLNFCYSFQVWYHFIHSFKYSSAYVIHNCKLILAFL